MNKDNLNDIVVDNDGNFPDVNISDNSISVESAGLTVLFRNQKRELLKLISQHDCIVGAVAWLTDEDILAALADTENVSIVVQKEDFLRPDLGAKKDWQKRLRCAYDKLQEPPPRFAWPGMMGALSTHCDPFFDSVRCVGNHNSSKAPAFPRMHNKFLVFGTAEPPPEESVFRPEFQTVWTGSYNLSRNAENSLENVVVIRNRDAAKAYYDEFCQIFALSEPLDWTCDWCAPEYRIGT